MFSRTHDDTQGTPLPTEWLQECKKMLESAYKLPCKKLNKYFEVYGEVYIDELVFMVSIQDRDNITAIPTTISLSVAISDKSDNKAILDNMVDATGIIIDDVFASKEEDDIFVLSWTELTIKKLAMFYKITRENILLTIEANKLLS